MQRFSIIIIATALPNSASGSLEAESIFPTPTLNKDWIDLYEKIKGETTKEKSDNAFSTYEMKAVAEYQRYEAETQLIETAKTLLQTLDKEGQELFLRTHAKWREYIELQAAFMTDSGRGGTSRTIYWRQILIDEIKLRTTLYQDMFMGKNIYKEKLYIY